MIICLGRALEGLGKRNFDYFFKKFNGYRIEERIIKIAVDEEVEKRIRRNKILYDYMKDFMIIDLDRDSASDDDEERKVLDKELSDIPLLYKQKYRNFGNKPAEFLVVAKMNDIEKMRVDYFEKFNQEFDLFHYIKKNWILTST